MIPWILIGVLVLLILLGIVAFLFSKNRKRGPDYYAFFVIGIVWMPLGIATGNNFFFIMGLAFMALGLVNKDKWKKNHPGWDKLSDRERRLKMITMLILLGLLVLGVFALFLVKHMS